MNCLIVTLDGPAGSGKSTVARRLARRMGLEFLDTGAMYRGLTAVCLDHGINPAEHTDRAIELARAAQLRFDWRADPPQLEINAGDGFVGMTDRLRDPDVTEKVSVIAALPQVRQLLVEAQRRIGQEHPELVSEGRDQGSIVFPDARAKFFLDAASKVRAHRRFEQLRRLGKSADEQQILDALLRRDYYDSNRADGPLICPDDAIRIDTSNMTLNQVVDHLHDHVRRRIGEGSGC